MRVQLDPAGFDVFLQQIDDADDLEFFISSENQFLNRSLVA